jgi:peptide/nickel transport system substrate-binding protein
MFRGKSLFSIGILVLLVSLTGSALGQEGGNILRFAFTQEPGILVDYFTDLGVSWNINHMYSQPPWGMDSEGNPIPLLVDELPSLENGGVSVTDDGKTVVQFTIADWAVWSDGAPIVADDFILVFDIRTDGISNMIPFRFVNGAELESVVQGETEKDVIITFAQSQPDWITAAYTPLPSHLLRERYETAIAAGEGFDTFTDWLRAPTVGNGPVVFDEWQSGSYIRFVRNENYWNDVWADEVLINFYPDNNVIEQLLISGDTDLTFAIPLLPALELVEINPNLKMINTFSGGRMEFQFNFQEGKQHPALTDVRVRRAIAMALDRQFIADELYNGMVEIPRSFWYGTPWYYEDTPQIEYDPEGAVELLREAGWHDEDGDGQLEAHGVEGVEDGTPLTFSAATYAGGGFTQYQDVLLAIQDYLAEIGIDMSITTYEVNVMHSSYTANSPFSTGAHDMYILGWGVGTDSIDQIELWACDAIPSEENPTGLNGAGICMPEMDELWDVLGTSMDPAERQEAANQIQQLIADQVLMVSMVNLMEPIVMNANLENYAPGRANSPWYTLAEMQIVE